MILKYLPTISPLFFNQRETTVFHDEPRHRQVKHRVLDVKQKHCVIVHGWNSPYWFLWKLKEALRARPEADDWYFWMPDYPTQWHGFDWCARDIIRVLEAQDTSWDDVILIGFSMGGVVARQMALEGFEKGFRPRALISIGAPQEGIAPWVPHFIPGPRSIHKSSTRLQALNTEARDLALRERMHFFAINHRDRSGLHRHDGLVCESSARGESLGEVGSRQTITVDFGRRRMPLFSPTPHVAGMSPHVMSPMIDLCARLFEEG